MQPTNFLQLDELAAITGRPGSWWRRHWLRMHQQHHFPRKLPGLWGWNRQAVEAWSAASALPASSSNDAAALQRTTPSNDNTPLVAAPRAVAEALLDARFNPMRHS